ncbi:unnamed protein product [Allacma fusca]|uniref:Uncharacterized protein n=1 Tax=Allacma fusca TaxID=39272 RepID=A0A8J2NYC9_9HEXA|nr:unnamed protein product [Allacma fusca]
MKEKNGARTSTPYVYRINDGVSSSASILQQVCEERGWREFTSDERKHDEWNFWWRTTTMKLTTVRQLSSSQHTNHIPKATTFCRKDFLARYLRRMHRTHGPIYDFRNRALLCHIPA